MWESGNTAGYGNMKRTTTSRIAAAALAAGAFLSVSCATTGAAAPNSDAEDGGPAPHEKVVKEPKPIAIQNTSNQKEAEFLERIDSLEIRILSAPPQTYTGRAFSSGWTIQASDRNGRAEADLDITVSYPSARTDDSVSYATAQIATDKDGRATFRADTPAFAVKDFVTFYPTPVSSSPAVVQDAYAAGTTAPYTVKSIYMTQLGVLYAYDFNEAGNPTTNSFNLLQNLRNAGVNIGNSPVSDTSYFKKPVSALYRDTLAIVGNSYAFMVVAALKWAGPAEEGADGVTCTLSADITCVSMKDGSVVYKTAITDAATDKTKWNAEQKCRASLCKKAADAIMYGM